MALLQPAHLFDVFIGKESLFPLALIGFEEGSVARSCHQEVGDVYKLEGAGLESEVGMVLLDGQIDAGVVHQVGSQNVFQHVEIVCGRVETYDHELAHMMLQLRD